MFVCEPRPPFGQLAGDRRGENKCVFGVEELESTKIQSTKNVKTYQALVSGVI